MRDFRFDWDGVRSEKELLIRQMLYGDPETIVKVNDAKLLRKIFLENIHRFDEKNRVFWKLVLRISDEELTKATAKNFREAQRIWAF